MADEYNWGALETIGTWSALAGAALVGVVRWFRRQREAVLKQVAELRTSHEKHVISMNAAHRANEERLIKLEVHEINNEGRLKDMNVLLKELNQKQDRQTELIMNILKQGRR